MKPLSRRQREKLRADWHGPEPIRAIAKRFRIEPRSVNRLWQEDKANGLLPDTTRPHYALPPSLTRVADAGPGWIGLAYDVDAKLDLAMSREEPESVAVPKGDPLLKALRRHHGNDPRRAFDDVKWSDARSSHTEAIAERIRLHCDSLFAAPVALPQLEKVQA